MWIDVEKQSKFEELKQPTRPSPAQVAPLWNDV